MNTPLVEEGDSGSFDLLDVLQMVADHLRLLISAPLVIGLIVFCGSYAITPTYTAMTTLLPPLQQQSSAAAMMQALGALGSVAAAGGLKSQADQYVAYISSRSVADALVERFDLVKRYGVELKHDARKALAGDTKISSARDGLIRIEFDDHDPKFAADVANAYVEELAKLMGRLSLTEAQQRRAFYENQLAKAKDNFARAEVELRSTGVNSDALKSSPQSVVSSVASLMAEVTAKEIRLSAMRNYLTENSPEFKKTQAELAALRTQLERVQKDGQPAAGGGDYVAKYRDYKYNETLFELLSKQYEIAKIDESREVAVVQVIDLALPPERKSKPKKASLAIGATLGTAVVLFFYLLLRLIFRNAVTDAESVRRMAGIRRSFAEALGRK
jgi:tyrosine-protein kinase Etk/Wzc